MKSPIADMKNACTSRYGGAITAALFLRQFVDTDKARGPPARPLPLVRGVRSDLRPRAPTPDAREALLRTPFAAASWRVLQGALFSYPEPPIPAIDQVWGTQTGDPIDAGSWGVLSLVS
jgi:hypothetical protein